METETCEELRSADILLTEENQTSGYVRSSDNDNATYILLEEPSPDALEFKLSLFGFVALCVLAAFFWN